MGEKIKDLQEISIGRSKFMIELNEGYTKDEGRLIHIQNSHYRYLLQEKEFIKLAAAVLRSKRELEYIKGEESIAKIKEVECEKIEPSSSETALFIEYCQILNDRGIEHRVISRGAGFISLIVKPQSRKSFIELMNELQKVSVLNHPYTEKAGYTYLYQMHAFELYQYNDILVESYYELPCKSFTDKTWIPLDKAIQDRVWNERNDLASGGGELDNISKGIFLLCWCVFHTKRFSESTKQFLGSIKRELMSAESKELLQLVFFKFTDLLLKHIDRGEFDQILGDYLSFSEY